MSLKYRILLAYFLLSTPFALATKILVFGDFGTDDDASKEVAQHMVAYCKEKGCDFAITTGDNIYPSGVDNDADGKPQYSLIVDKFVNKYQALKIPIYMSFGNHDVGNEGVVSTFKNFFTNRQDINRKTETLMLNQLNFSDSELNPQLSDEEGQRLWVFPKPYYAVNPKDNPDIMIVAVDTNSYPHQAFQKNKSEIDTDDPENNRQDRWLDNVFNKVPQKTWKIVFGHQPIYSHGLHGFKDKEEIEKFRNSIVLNLCDDKVDFYISGHDHHLEIDKHLCGKDENAHVVNFILTGAAAKETDIKLITFPFFGTDENLIWANGITYEGSSSDFRGNTKALGFTYIDIDDTNNTAKVHMILTKKDRPEQQDQTCFVVERGKAMKPGC